MATEDMDDYFIYHNRLASFHRPQAIAKRRTSSATHSRAPKTLSWPHKSIKPVDMAKAGFIFQPGPSHPDNVACFLCHKPLDGWEDDDDPLEEHLKHSPECGWAITTAVEAELGEYAREDPRDALMLEARMATFADRWPHDSKKGWSCKTKQLVEAGWKYTPTLDSDDMATCTYCQLALDGWEKSDNPWDEHYSRTPNCPFFSLISSKPAPKTGQSKVARRTKASRLSLQSVATLVSDSTSVADVTVDIDDSDLTTASATTTASKGPKKTTKGRKAATTTRTRNTRAKKEETVEVQKDELELEATMPPPSPKLTKGRKRASEEVEDSVMTNSEAPAPKKRATKTRKARSSSATEVSQADTHMLDAPEPAKKPAAKKTTRKASGTRKASVTRGTRKVSGASTEPAAPAGVPDDAEIDRQLQVNLERPLTDDEKVTADPETEKAAASSKEQDPMRKEQDSMQNSSQDELLAHTATTDFAMFDPAAAQPTDAQIDADLKSMEDEMGVDQKEDTEEIKVPKRGRPAGTRKVSKRTTITKKASDPAAPVEKPHRRATLEAEEPDEIAEANVSFGSSGTVVRKSVGRASLASVASSVSAKSTAKRGRPAKKSKLSSQETDVEAPVLLAAAAEPAAEPVPEPVPEPVKVDAEPAPGPVEETKRTSTGKRGRPAKKPKLSQDTVAEPPVLPAAAAAAAEPVAEPAADPVKVDAEPAPGPVEETKRTSTGKRGRPPKKSKTPDVALVGPMATEPTPKESTPKEPTPEEPTPEEPAPAEAPAEEKTTLGQTEVQVESAKIQERLPAVSFTPQIARKPVPAPKDSPFVIRDDESSIMPSGSQVLPVPTTPRQHASPAQSAKQATVSPSPSPQASDAENQPPSSNPNTGSGIYKRMPMGSLPVQATPMRQTSPSKGLSPSKQTIVGGLQSSEPWTAIDLDLVLEDYYKDQENEGATDRFFAIGGELTRYERDMTVEEWIYYNAGQAEQKLKFECESMVTAFEREGTRAMRTLEGLVVE